MNAVSEQVFIPLFLKKSYASSAFNVFRFDHNTRIIISPHSILWRLDRRGKQSPVILVVGDPGER